MEQRIRRYRSHHQLELCGSYIQGRYRSQWYCGLYAGMEWLRLSLDGADGALVRVYGCDAPGAEWDDALPPALERTSDDLLLYGVRGRYLCFTVEPADKLIGYELAFPGLSIAAQLPAVMEGDETLRRLLGVYQSLYMDTNRAMLHFPDRLKPNGPTSLPGLGHWLGADGWMQCSAFGVELLAEATRLNRLRGTQAGIYLLLELVIGRGCTLVEHFQWKAQEMTAEERAACAKLYGDEPASIALLLPPEVSGEARRCLTNLLDDFIPVGVQYRLVGAREGAAMDEHTYLELNVQLTDPQAAPMDDAEIGMLILE